MIFATWKFLFLFYIAATVLVLAVQQWPFGRDVGGDRFFADSHWMLVGALFTIASFVLTFYLFSNIHIGKALTTLVFSFIIAVLPYMAVKMQNVRSEQESTDIQDLLNDPEALRAQLEDRAKE